MQGEIVCYLEDNKFETIPYRVEVYGGKQGHLLGAWDMEDLPGGDSDLLDFFDNVTARVSQALGYGVANNCAGILSDGGNGILSWTVTIGTKKSFDISPASV